MADDTRPNMGEIATTLDGRDITRPFMAPFMLLQPQDSVLQTRGQGDLRIYEELLRDDQIKATLAQRQLAVVSAEWEVEAASERPADTAAADFLREQLHRIRFDDVTAKMFYGLFYGYAVAECLYARDGRHVVIEQLRVRNRRRFRFGGDGRLRLVTPQAPNGEALPDRKFWVYSVGADHDDEPYGLGLAHWLYWPAFFKRNGLRLWLIFLDKFGQPTAKGQYPASASSDDIQKLLDALAAIHTDSGIAIPEGMAVELIEAARSGTADYTGLYDRMNAAISKVVLGHTGSADATPGRLGGEDMARDVRQDIVKADADVICASFNDGPVRWLTQWNFPDAEPPRVWRRTDEGTDLEKQARIDKDLHAIGYRPTLQHVQEIYGQGYEEKPPEPSRPAGGFPPAFAEGERQAPEVLADRLEREADPHVSAMVAAVERVVRESGSLEEARERILDLYEELPADRLAKAMQLAWSAMELGGRDDAAEGD